jgi:hypothetical protein
LLFISNKSRPSLKAGAKKAKFAGCKQALEGKKSGNFRVGGHQIAGLFERWRSWPQSRCRKWKLPVRFGPFLQGVWADNRDRLGPERDVGFRE